MEPLFSMETVMTEKLYTRFHKLHYKSSNTWWALCIPSVFFIPLAIQFLFVLHNSLAGIMMLLFGIFLPILIKIALNNSIKAMIKNNQGFFGMPYTIVFYGSEYVEYSLRGEVHMPYYCIYKLIETEDLLLLYQNKMSANIVDKTKMTKGTAAELTAFLRIHCPAPYTYVGK